MKKKIIFVLFGLLCLFGSIFADTSFKFKLTEDGTGLCIDEYTGTDSIVFIQAYYDGMPVKEIGREAFYCNNNITMVSLPYTVESIGEDAFSKCKNLATINLPSTIRFIGGRAFKGCASLSEIVFDSLNYNISWGRDYFNSNAYSTFSGCSALSMSSQLRLIKMGYPDSF